MDVVKLDVTNETEVEAASQYIEQKYAKLDLLINCAAMLHPSGKGETSLKEVSSQVEYFVLQNSAILVHFIGPSFVLIKLN